VQKITQLCATKRTLSNTHTNTQTLFRSYAKRWPRLLLPLQLNRLWLCVIGCICIYT